MTVSESIEKRWSPRAFKDQAIPKEKIKSLLNAARKAPSSFNEQPWRVVLGIKGENSHEKVSVALNEFNRKWADAAPLLMLCFAKKTFSRNGNPNRHCWHDVGAFSSYFSLRAMEEGIYVHQMAGILPNKVNETFDIPEDYELVTAVAVGYPGDPDQLPKDLREGESPESPRKELSEIAFSEEWGRAF